MIQQMQRPESAPTKRRGARRRRNQIAGLLVAPALLLVLVFFVIPLGMAFWMSLHNWPLLGKPRFIGVGNYTRLVQDAQFWSSLRFTVYYTLVVTVAIFAVAFPLALFAEKSRPLTKIYRTAFFLPVVVGFGSASLLWAWLLDVDSGLFSPAAFALGLISLARGAWREPSPDATPAEAPAPLDPPPADLLR